MEKCFRSYIHLIKDADGIQSSISAPNYQVEIEFIFWSTIIIIKLIYHPLFMNVPKVFNYS